MVINPLQEQEVANGERRRYFRIDDNVLMSIRRIDQRQVDKELESFDSTREAFCFSNTAELEQQKHAKELRGIQEDYPSIAGYITYLESRIDTLARIVSSQHSDPEQVEYKVNVSAQGIRFHSDRIFDTEDVVELRIELLPQHKRLLLIGTVVWCVDDPKALGKYKHAVAVDFTYIDAADREVLVKHINTKQIQQLNNTAQADNSP